MNKELFRLHISGDFQIGERIENSFLPDTQQESDFVLCLPCETFDVCINCRNGLSTPKEDVDDFRDRTGPRTEQGLDIFYNGNPPGDYWSFDVEHPPYEDDEYKCQVCEIYLMSDPSLA